MVTIVSVKKNFDNLLTLREDICAVFDILKSKVEILQKIYLELVKNHAHKSYVFGIDSFHFQNKLIEKEYLNLTSAFEAIDNRIYCEYYSLYTMIQKYATKDVKDDKLSKSASFNHNFEPYKHLDNKSYSFTTIKDIHLAISSCITELEAIHTAREAELRNDRHQSELGLNIDNLVYTEMFNNHILKAKIDMFFRYLEVFNDHHVKYFTRLLLKSKLHMGIVNEDIMIKQFNQSGGSTDIEKLQKYKPNTPSPQHNFMREEEDKKIKSYIKYEHMGVSKQNVLNGIIAAAGSDSSAANSEDSNENENISFDVKETEDEDEEEELIDINTNPVLQNLNESVHIKGKVDIMPILEESPEIPEESEIASNIGEHHSNIKQEDIGKRVMVEGYDSIGTLVFFGDHNSKPGKRCGVILDDSIGRNNGTVGDYKYFECEDKKGVLVAPYKVKFVDNDSDDENEPL